MSSVCWGRAERTPNHLHQPGAAGLAGGFVLAVPVPLAMYFIYGRKAAEAAGQWMPALGTTVTIVLSIALLVAFDARGGRRDRGAPVPRRLTHVRL